MSKVAGFKNTLWNLNDF